VALDSVAKLRTEVTALTIAHLGQLPAVTISFNLLPGVSLGDAVGRVDELARNTLPASIRTSFQEPPPRTSPRWPAWESCSSWPFW